MGEVVFIFFEVDKGMSPFRKHRFHMDESTK